MGPMPPRGPTRGLGRRNKGNDARDAKKFDSRRRVGDNACVSNRGTRTVTAKRATMVGAMLAAMAIGPVLAQEPPAVDGSAAAPGGEATGADRGARARRKPTKVIEMDVLEVIGKVQKPRVYYVIGRGELKYHGLPLERDLLKEVEETVEGPPF